MQKSPKYSSVRQCLENSELSRRFHDLDLQMDPENTESSKPETQRLYEPDLDIAPAQINEPEQAKLDLKIIDETAAMREADRQLLSQYYDIMDLVAKHPVCVYAVKSMGVWPQNLTNAIKTHGPGWVIECLVYAKNYPGARNRSSFFNTILANGIFLNRTIARWGGKGQRASERNPHNV